MWPIQFSFRLRISCRTFLCSLTLSNNSPLLRVKEQRNVLHTTLSLLHDRASCGWSWPERGISVSRCWVVVSCPVWSPYGFIFAFPLIILIKNFSSSACEYLIMYLLPRTHARTHAVTAQYVTSRSKSTVPRDVFANCREWRHTAVTDVRLKHWKHSVGPNLD
jgi:hypothetical protein